MLRKTHFFVALSLFLTTTGFASDDACNIASRSPVAQTDARHQASTTSYHRVAIDDVEVFYREAGSRNAPTVVLLHGFPTSSHMFRNLIPKLADRYHVIAPDYPGYGNSSMPSVDEFEYTFDSMTNVVDKLLQNLNVDRYSLYLMDYGAPVGFRLAVRHPERVESLIIQNGNAYAEGLREFWKPLKAYWKNQTPENADALKGLLTIDATKWQYTHGVRNTDVISPDTWGHVQPLLDRDGNQEIQLAMFLDYGSNPGRYPEWQAYLRKHQPPTLIVWGQNDHIFPAEGAHPYKRDLRNLEFHLLDTGHFALEEDGDVIAKHIRGFLGRTVADTGRQVSSR
jgi:pimeloyl-ACP methyl ester carboxylesterase